MTTSGLSLLGVNLSGAEFGSGDHYGYNYIYPTHAEIDYYASKNLNVIRLPFEWERLQPTLDGALDSAELGRIKDIVDYAATKGVNVILDPHDYGGYGGNLIGSAAVPNSAFADFWGQLSAQFKDTPNVMFGLMNEPNQQSATTWLGSANAAIAAIRQSGAQQEILVPGSYWDGGASWTTSDNAAVVGTGVVDPANNYAFEVHQYLDSDQSGTHPTVVSTSIGVDRLTAITAWAESTGSRLFLGEFAVGQDATSLTAMNNMLSFMSRHSDVWQGATYWGAGPWWGDYMYSIEPSNGVDKPQMAVLDAYAPGIYGLPVVAQPPVVSPPVVQPPIQPPPAVQPPVVTALLASDTGASGSDGITSKAVLSGTGDASATVSFTVDGGAWSVTALADATGAWSANFSALADGAHTIVASESNTGGTATATVGFTLDTTAPVPAITSKGGVVFSAAQVITGTGEAGSTVSLFDGAVALGQPVTVATNGTWSAQVTFAAAGPHVITATDTDIAGNAGTSAAVIATMDHPPTFVSGGGGITAIYDVAATAKQIATIQAADPDVGDTVSYALLDPKGNKVAKTGGFVINAQSGVLTFDGRPTAGLHSATVVASDTYGGSAVQNVKVNVAAAGHLVGASGAAGVGQTFMFDPTQRTTVVQNFQVADTTTNGMTTPHSVLDIAHTLFNGTAAGSTAGAALLASHSRQYGMNTLLMTDTGQCVDLVNVNRQALLAHPSAVAFV